MSVKNKVTLLLVDDHPGFLDEVSGLLANEYKIVATARNGQSAINAARKFNPDIVLLDIEMPVLNGIEVAYAIRKAGLTSRIVFLTMHTDPDYAAAAIEAGHRDMFSSLIFTVISRSRSKWCWRTGSLSRDMLPEEAYAGTRCRQIQELVRNVPVLYWNPNHDLRSASGLRFDFECPS
jgi:CheY-like chemotaxis protein